MTCDQASMEVVQKAFIADAGSLLMIQYGAIGQHDWDLPGGRVSTCDSSLDAALVREVQEEVGLTATISGPPLAVYLAIHWGTQQRAMFVIQRVHVVGTLTFAGQVGDDIVDMRWVPFDEVATLKMNPGVGPHLLAIVSADLPSPSCPGPVQPRPIPTSPPAKLQPVPDGPNPPTSSPGPSRPTNRQ